MKSAGTLEEYLDVKNHTISSRLYWINKIGQQWAASEPMTFKMFIDELRDIIEHEVQYIPENV